MRNTKLPLLLLLLMLSLTASAYTDHRYAKVDSAEQVLMTNKQITDQQRMACYYIIVRGTLGHDTEKHNRYCHSMLALTYKMNALNMRENALNHLGLEHYGQEHFKEAEHYFLWAIAITDSMRGDKRYTQADIDDNYSQLYGALGNLYNLQDKALLAIEYYQKALPIFEKHGWLESQTILHHNVAELWLTMGNSEKAEQEYLQAIKTGTASGDSLMMVLPRKGLVKVYLDQSDYEKVRQTIGPAYDYYHAHRGEEHQDYAEILTSMAKMNLMDGHEDLIKAKTYIHEALSYAEDELMFETKADIYAAATMIAMREHNWQQALNYALQSVHDNDDEATYSDVGCYELLAQIYIELGDKQKAKEYTNKIRTMMERFATENYQSGLSQMEVLYETEKKEAQIERMDMERRQHLWLLGLAVALLIVVIALLIYFQLAHRRQKELLAARVALDTETKERRILASDLHDSIGGMLSVLRLKMENDASKEETMQLLNHTTTELRRVAHHLMPEELLRGGLRQALADFALSVPGAQFHYFCTDDVQLHQDLELVLYRCAYELVNNALRHADAQHINIQLMLDKHEVTLTVSDDGKGIGNEERKEKSEEGTGLQNIRNRISRFGGKLDIISTVGTEINVTIPL